MTWSGTNPRRTQLAQPPTRWVTAALTLSLSALTLLGSSTSSTAQSTPCEIPRVVTTQPVTASTAEPAPASVGAAIIQIEGQEATPAASQAAASPVASVPDPAALLAQELTLVSEALAACLTAGDEETVVALAGERYLGQMFGGSVPLSAEEYIALAGQLTPIPTRIISIADVAEIGEDRATAAVIHVVGNQLVSAEWTFSQVDEDDRADGESRWRLDGERQIAVSPPPGATPLGVEIGERSFELSASEVAGPDVVLRGINVAAEDHEMLVLRLAQGYTTADLLRATGPDLPQEVTFIGERPVPAGAQADLVLVDLPPGDYTIICLFTDSQGLPHLAQGMEAEFTVN